jgi:uncharacterized protein YndB with AHSA1/START domain
MTVSKAPARAIADLADGVVLATVDIAAPPERVFAALTDPKELAAWWGSPETYRADHWETDVRVGGKFVSRGHGRDGKPFSVTGEYLVIDSPRRLVHTWRYDWGSDTKTTVAYALDPIDGGTRVTVRHAGFAPNSAGCSGHAAGWEGVLGWLRGHAEVTRFFVCRLIPPRDNFAETMTDPERSVMMAHVAYWTKHAEAGTAIVFGPVADPKGRHGIAIVRVHDDAELAKLQREDPAITGDLGMRYETAPMVRAVVAR